jgi:hypothetical protein
MYFPYSNIEPVALAFFIAIITMLGEAQQTIVLPNI